MTVTRSTKLLFVTVLKLSELNNVNKITFQDI